jgi:hypothetical protein
MSDESLGRRRRAARRAPRCWWCGEVAEHLCDVVLFPFGTKTVKAIEHAVTCDAPMCARHAKVVGFMCSNIGPPSPCCGAPTRKGGECERVTGGGRCSQHAGVAIEVDDPEVHACPFCEGLGERPRDVDPDEHRRDARIHGGRSQMAVVPAEPQP